MAKYTAVGPYPSKHEGEWTFRYRDENGNTIIEEDKSGRSFKSRNLARVAMDFVLEQLND